MEQTFTRARELCQQLGDTPQLFPVLWGLWYMYYTRAEYQMAWELGTQCLALAQSAQDPALLVEAHFVLGVTLLTRGEFAPAQEQFEQGMALYDPKRHHSHAFLYGQDPGVTSSSIAAWVLWYLGYPEQARKRTHAAVTLARELSHPYSLVYAFGCAAWLHLSRREGQAGQEWAESAITLCTEHTAGSPKALTRRTYKRPRRC